MALAKFMQFFFGNRPREIHSGDVRLKNTRSGKKELFTSLTPHEVRMYNCGPTVYAYAHIGNLRAYVFADTLRRVLTENGYSVKQVINITDVGHLTSDADDGADKMEEGAKREGKTAHEIATFFTESFMNDLAALNIDTRDVFFPRATDHIGEQIALIQTLQEKGYTYKTSDGIYFDTAKFPRYGALGGIDLSGLKEGARIAINTEKKNPTDFALWKFSKPEEQRQQEWASPWGRGFPGWHIECSAMSMKYLGSSFDIHTGGIDHIPVHHNNEIAQSEAATGRTFARFWMHSAHVSIEGKKISKSLGNTVTLSQLSQRGIPALAYRLFLLSAHYTTSQNFTWDAVAGNASALLRLRKYFVEKLSNARDGKINTGYFTKFRERMNDDLDTPRALAILWDLVKDETVSTGDKRATLLAMDRYVGLGLNESNEALADMLGSAPMDAADLPDEIGTLVKQRENARHAKDWKRADELRAAIEEKGYLVTDSADGQKIKPKK